MTIEELQEELLKEKENNQQIKAQYENLENENKKLKEDNKNLTEYNNKLFMRLSKPIEQEEKQKELTPEEEEQKLINEIIKIMEE